VSRGVTSCHSRLGTSCRTAVVGSAREVSSLVPFRNISSSTVINKRLAGSQMASKRSAKGRSSPLKTRRRWSDHGRWSTALLIIGIGAAASPSPAGGECRRRPNGKIIKDGERMHARLGGREKLSPQRRREAPARSTMKLPLSASS
jgi:hypothetical protein